MTLSPRQRAEALVLEWTDGHVISEGLTTHLPRLTSLLASALAQARRETWEAARCILNQINGHQPTLDKLNDEFRRCATSEGTDASQ